MVAVLAGSCASGLMPGLRRSVRRVRVTMASDGEAEGVRPLDLDFVCESSGRLDACLAGRSTDRSRREWAEAIELGAVCVNGIVAKRKSQGVAAGDAVSVDGSSFARDLGSSPGRLVPEDLPLDVLLEDESVLVVNKAAGMVTHPAPGAPFSEVRLD